MKVKDLISMLSKSDPDFTIVVNCDGSVFGLDDTSMEDQLDDYAENKEFAIIASDEAP